MTPSVPPVVLIGKPGCHLCDQARPIVAQLCSQFGLEFQELSIADDPVLADKWFELIPVVLLDGQRVAQWWVDPQELHAALAARASGPQAAADAS